MRFIQDLFTSLSQMVEGSPFIALSAAFIWGILSIILSPCHLASIPLVVGFINGQGQMKFRRALWLSSLFAAGILVTIALIGLITAAAGRMMGDLGQWGNYFVAIVFFIVGLALWDVIPIFKSGPSQINFKSRGYLAALVLGLVFGVALGPCTFAYMAPLMAIVMQMGVRDIPYAVLLLSAYGFGHCAVIAAAGASTGLVQQYLNWTERSKGSIILKRICGTLVILGGVYLILTVR